MEEFKQAQRAMWDAGDYGALSEYIAQVGERVVARAGVEAGMSVLDVACGTGNAAIPAARAGAHVTGLDLVPKLLDDGREKAVAAGVEVDWVEGDAEQLPFDDGDFDRVFSTFGHMFAPRHSQVADEMARVCGEGGAIAICCWTPEGTVGELFEVSASYMPPPPDFASPPILWGTEEHVREMFAGVATDFEFERHSATIEWDSTEGFADFFMDRFGPMVTARNMLGDRFAGCASEPSRSGRRRTRRATAVCDSLRSTCCRSSVSELGMDAGASCGPGRTVGARPERARAVERRALASPRREFHPAPRVLRTSRRARSGRTRSRASAARRAGRAGREVLLSSLVGVKPGSVDRSATGRTLHQAQQIAAPAALERPGARHRRRSFDADQP